MLKKAIPKSIPNEADCGHNPFNRMQIQCKKLQQIFSYILPKECTKTIKTKWVQSVMECVVVDGWYFGKDRWKRVASESVDECSVFDSK